MTAAVFVGRSRELRGIDSALERTHGGQRSVLLISGEAGIGKSRLADELCARAQARGFATAWGGAWEAGGAPSFWPWLQLLRALERKLGELADPALVARLALRPDAEPETAHGSSDRFALFDSVARCIEAACARAPLALVLDDVHAADVASLGLFEFLVQHVRDLPVLLCATYREAEARELDQVDAALGRMRREANVLRLGALDEAEVHALVAASGTANNDVLARRVCELTGGSPLFALEVLRVLESDPGLLASEALTSADGLRAAIREHLRLLGPEARAALDAAAVIGREFTGSALRALHGSDCAELLASAARRGVIAPLGADHFRFVHVLLRDTLHADLEPTRRAQLHARYAQWLAEAPQPSRDAALAEIAHHLLLAGPGRVREAADAVLAAARHAVRVFAFEHAVELCTRALEALDMARCADLERRFELLAELGVARIHAGDATLGKADCVNAAQIARSLGGPEYLARATLAYGTAFTFGQIDPVLVRLCEESLAALPADAFELRARVLARHAAAQQPAQDVNVPVEFARQALALVDRLDNLPAKLSVAYSALSALMDIIDPRERLVWNERVFGWASELGEQAMALHTRRRLIIDHMELGEFALAKRLLDEYAQATLHVKQPHGRWQLPLFRSAIALVEGRLSDHAQHFAEAKSIAGPLIGRGVPLVTFLLHELVGARARGEPAQAHAMTRALAATPPPVQYYWDAVLAHDAAERGELEAARGLLARHDPSVIAKHHDGMLMSLEVETALLLDDHAWARAARRELEQSAEDCCSWGLIGYAVDGPIARPLFMACALLGDWDAATKHHERARLWCERLGNRPMLCRVQIAWAELLARRGSAEQAAAIAREAEVIAREYAMPDPLQRAERLLARQAPTRAECGLSREGDVWRLTGLGFSCVVRDSRGLAFLARLLEQPGRELHVLDLVGAPDEVRHERGTELLDEQAQRAYRGRVRELEAELEEADEFRDLGRAERLREELESLHAELARGVGLGGRARRGADAAERARVNVQRRISDAIERIRAIQPALAEHLEKKVRTGLFCVYEP